MILEKGQTEEEPDDQTAGLATPSQCRQISEIMVIDLNARERNEWRLAVDLQGWRLARQSNMLP